MNSIAIGNFDPKQDVESQKCQTLTDSFPGRSGASNMPGGAQRGGLFAVTFALVYRIDDSYAKRP